MMTKSPIIIIGSGMAGYTLARELRKLSPEVAITVVCRDAGDSYSKPTLSNAFAQNKLADSIAIGTAESVAEALNLTVLNFYNVSHLDTANKTITIHPALASDKQEILPYSQLVLAMGANPRGLPNVTVDNEQIFAVNHLDDYKKFQQKIHTLSSQKQSNDPVKVAIVGAGLIGCEFANDLINKNLTENSQTAPLAITVFDKASLPMTHQLPSQAGEALQNALTQAGVAFKLGVDIAHIATDKHGVTVAIRHADNAEESFHADVLLIAIGLVANTALAQEAGLAVAHLSPQERQTTHLPRTAQQGILVNQFLQTSTPDVYAIGDCANVMGSFMPYVMPLMNQAKTLAKTLASHAENPNSLATALHYPAMPVAIKTPNLPLVVLPVAGQYSEEQITWQTETTSDGMLMTARSTDNPNTLLGFVLVGKEAGKQRMALTKQVADWLPLMG